MITDLEVTIRKQGDAGTGGTEQQPDGTWLAWCVIEPDDQGIYAAGCSEGHALSALTAKLKALGGLMAAAYAEAECRHRMRTQAEEAKQLADLIDTLSGGTGKDPFAGLPSSLKKPEGN